jgi:hypothetical protein
MGYMQYSRLASFAGLRIAVLLIRGKIIVVILVHRGVGPSLFCGRSCAGARSKPQLPTSALKKGIQMMDNLVDHFFEVDHFMERYLKFEHEMEAVMAPYKETYKGMQKKAKQPKSPSSSSSLLSPPPPCILHRSISLTTFCQERRRHPNKHQH